MITTGQALTNPVTGETLVFRTTSADTNGERVVVETFVEPNGAVAAAHMHPGAGGAASRSSAATLELRSSARRRSSRSPATASSSRPGRPHTLPQHRRRRPSHFVVRGVAPPSASSS